MTGDKREDGGPAFPSQFRSEGEELWEPSPGLSLRDYFASAAMQGLMASGPHDCGPDGIAHDAWMLADAMIKARQSTGGQS